MTTLLRSVCCVLLVGAAGCVRTGAPGPDYAAGPVGPHTGSPSAWWGESSTREAEVEALARKAEIGLEDLLRIAELNNPEVRAARDDVGAAAGRAWQAELYPNPTLELEAEDVPADGVGLGESQNKVAIVQPFILGGRRTAATSAAAAERDARALLAQARLREVQSELQRVHAEIVYLKQALALHSELDETARETLRVATARLEAMASPESEVTKARIDAHERALSRRRLDRLLTASSERLASLLGGVRVPVGAVGGALPREHPELDVEKLKAAVRERHPAVLAAAKGAEVAGHRVDQARAERIPDIDVRVAYVRDAAMDEDFLEGGISIPLPFFNRNQGRILESRRLAARAERDAEALLNELLSELAMAHADYMTARDEIEILQGDIVPAAERAFHQAREGHRAGKTGFLDLLEAQRTSAGARLSLLESVRDVNVARAELWGIVGPEVE